MSGEACYSNKRRALKPVVPEILTAGTPLVWKVDMDDQVAAVPYIFKVDPNGFYLYARSDKNKEAHFWDMCLISDVRIAESSGQYHERLNRRESALRDLLFTRRESIYSPKECDEESYNNCVLHMVYRKEGIANLEFITLIAQNPEVASTWMDAINSLTHNLYLMNCSISDMVKKMRVKMSLHANGHGKLPLHKIDKELSAKSGSRMESIKFSLEIFEVSILDSGDDSYIEVDKLTDEIVEDMISRVAHCTDRVQTVFLEQGCKIPNMDEVRLLKFLNQVQRDPRDNEVINEYHEKKKAISVIHTLEPKGKEIGKLTPVGMWRFLASEESNLVDIAQLGLVMDMSQPLSHYYINSSHNTYCCGAQINGLSSIEMYRQCLLQGCRCVELDCWIQNDDIIVTHGFMSGVWVCTTVPFEKVLQAIRDFAFVTTDYPLILSIENHVDKPHLLKRMAFLYTASFGDRLMKEPLKGYPLEPGFPLPSPELMKGKILLKDKIRLSKSKDIETSKLHVPEDAAFNAAVVVEGSICMTSKILLGRAQSMPVLPTLSSTESLTSLDDEESKSANSDSAVENDDSTGDDDENAFENKDEVEMNGTSKQIFSPTGYKIMVNGISSSVIFDTSKQDNSTMLSKIDEDAFENKDEVKMNGTIAEEIMVNGISNSVICDTSKQDNSTMLSKIDEDAESSPATDEENWIVPDNYTLQRRHCIKRKVPRNTEKPSGIKDRPSNLLKSWPRQKPKAVEPIEFCLETHEYSDDMLRRIQLHRVSEGMALVGGPIVGLLNYCTAVKFDGFEAAEKRDHWNYISSMDEDKAMQNLTDHPVEFAKYNARQFSRIYPGGMRMNSTNYLPNLYWSAGCQIVALNYQTPDLSMQLNFAKFEQNLKCGYILKPSILRNAKVIPFNLFDQHFENIVPCTVTVKILSGLFLSERLNMVDIEMFGLPVDTVHKGVMKTHYQLGPHPEWNNHDETFAFKKVVLPELCSLRFSVTDDKGDLIGQRVLPLSMIRSGYRFVTLRDKYSQPLLLTSLFVFIKIEDFVPDHLKEFVVDLQRPRIPSPIPGKGKIMAASVSDSRVTSRHQSQRLSLTTLPVEHQIIAEVLNRNIPAIKPDDIVVTNSKRMIKFNKRIEKEFDMMERNYKLKLGRTKRIVDGYMSLLRRTKSSEPDLKNVIDGDAEKQMAFDHQEEVQHFQFKTTEERYRETAIVLASLHEEQVKTLLKIQEKELAACQKMVTSAYCEQISVTKNKQNDRIGDATLKHLRLEIAKKCTEKIQELRDLHSLEMKKLTSTQNEMQEQLQRDKEESLNHYQLMVPAPQQ
ncbi:1-phosphatidylinositol 4,5-bisphosphate phosphodiesterase beta-4-like isoform X2 [Dysidea avara]|uniref:1-phosphatidylinositol 4,5-bisphosphate phosphodiesterase beta-4-like isoform X2 n=1 Tax=Dysidea avara TaxID=196820 RepID=UPI0033191155